MLKGADSELMYTTESQGFKSSKPLLQAKNLTISRGARVLLERISFDLNPGDRMAILGGSGSGKSSLFKCLLGNAVSPGFGLTSLQWLQSRLPKLYQYIKKNRFIELVNDQLYIIEGDIFLLGYPLPEKGGVSRWLNSHAGVLFQTEALFQGQSVGYNLKYPMKYGAAALSRHLTSSQLDRAVHELLRDVRLLSSSEENAKNMVDRDIEDLSGGERKRVALARAFANRPDLLFLDEPTSGLDSQTAESIANTLNTLCSQHGTTVVCVTHDSVFARKLGCNKIAEIDSVNQSLTVNDSGKSVIDVPAGPYASAITQKEKQNKIRQCLLYFISFLSRFKETIINGGKLCVPVSLIAGAGLVIQGVAGPKLIERFLVQGVTAGIFMGMGTIMPALLVIGLCGSGITGEIAQKKHTNQLEYLRLIGVSPALLFNIPIIAGMTVAVPLLVWVSEYFMLIGGKLTLMALGYQTSITPEKFWYDAWRLIDIQMLTQSGVKGLTHGAITGLVAGLCGVSARASESGLRDAIAACVIFSSLFIIFADVFWSWVWAGSW